MPRLSGGIEPFSRFSSGLLASQSIGHSVSRSLAICWVQTTICQNNPVGEPVPDLTFLLVLAVLPCRSIFPEHRFGCSIDLHGSRCHDWKSAEDHAVCGARFGRFSNPCWHFARRGRRAAASDSPRTTRGGIDNNCRSAATSAARVLSMQNPRQIRAASSAAARVPSPQQFPPVPPPQFCDPSAPLLLGSLRPERNPQPLRLRVRCDPDRAIHRSARSDASDCAVQPLRRRSLIPKVRHADQIRIRRGHGGKGQLLVGTDGARWG